MAYRNKTYVIFDGDNDMWAYAYMKGWKINERVDFDFHDAHDLKKITALANEATIKRTLRERFSNAKQVVLLVGKQTKNLYRFVRWEIEVALNLNLPIVVVNLNGRREIDIDLCPPLLRKEAAVHVSFNMAIIRYALDDFSDHYISISASREAAPYHYPHSVYKQLGL